MENASPSSFPVSLLGGLFVCVFLTGCGLTTNEETLKRGVFVLNSRQIDSAAAVGDDNTLNERRFLKFGQLTGKPQLRFRGRLVGGRSVRPNGDVRVKKIETLGFDAFHAGPEEKRRLANEGKLNPETLTFREAVGRSKSVVIYVHGFNNDARDAATQALEIQEEFEAIGHDATLLFYTWPTSKDYFQVIAGGALRRVTFGGVDALLNDIYLGDRKNVDLASHALYAAYEELSAEYPDLDIDIIAHSMGSEVVLKSFMLWHYQKLAQGERSPQKMAVVRRVVLVGADIGIDTFKILAQPTGYAAEQILVYVNPRDDVLKESAQLNHQSRLGRAQLDEPIPGLTNRFTFVEFVDPLVPRGVNLARLLLVNHNAIRDDRIRRHACEFVTSGNVETANGSEIVLQRINQEPETSGDAARYRLKFRPDPAKGAADTVNAILSPLEVLPNMMGDAAGALESAVQESP